MTKLTGNADLDNAITRAEEIIIHLHEIELLLKGKTFSRYITMLDTAGALVFAVKEALGEPE